MPSQHQPAVVIGAGLSGLVCAYRLKRLGIAVTLLEASSQVGGVIRSKRVDDYLIELGPNSARGTPDLLALVDELGLSHELLEGDPKAPAYVYCQGRLRAVPMSPFALIKSDLLSLGGKLRLLKEPFVSKRAASAEESVADFVSRRLGSEIAERLVAPFVSGIYAGDEKRLSVQAAFPLLANLERDSGSLLGGAIAKMKAAKRAAQTEKPRGKRSISFQNGMSRLPQALAARVGESLLCDSSEIAVATGQAGEAQGKFVVRFRRGEPAQQITCDHLIIATPAFVAASLIETAGDAASRWLGEIDYPPLVILHLAYERARVAHALDGFGFLVVPSEPLNLLGCIFSSSQFAGRAPQGQVLLTIFVGGARRPELAGLSDDELLASVHEDLQKVLGITSAPRLVSVTRWARAIPQYNLGHAARVQELEAAVSKIPGLHLAGNYLHGVSLGDCIKEAERVAGAAAAEIQAADEKTAAASNHVTP